MVRWLQFSFLLMIPFMAGCENLFHSAVEDFTDSRIEQGMECQTLRVSCDRRDYREWQNNDDFLSISVSHGARKHDVDGA